MPSEDVATELDDFVPLPIPDYAEQIYLSVLREVAKGYEHDGTATVEQRLAQAGQWPSFLVAAAADNRVAPVSGPMRNGAIAQSRARRVFGGRNDTINWVATPP